MPESPRYLYSKKRFAEAAAVIERIAKLNLSRDCTFIFEADQADDDSGPSTLIPGEEFGKSQGDEINGELYESEL
jgi:hypothetical protein